jgi:lipopolysaccharide/colanic/teichoic acid biosynthesis glycosyltransferase
VKIRTLNNNKISKFSDFLRKTKLDEIPQFISVARGDLNLIGPRPLLVEYKQYFKNSEEIRFSIKPGITGLSQIKSTNLTSWDTRLRWDVIYAKKRCFKLDIYILLNTIKIIFLNIFKKQNNLDNFIRLDKVRKI